MASRSRQSDGVGVGPVIVQNGVNSHSNSAQSRESLSSSSSSSSTLSEPTHRRTSHLFELYKSNSSIHSSLSSSSSSSSSTSSTRSNLLLTSVAANIAGFQTDATSTIQPRYSRPEEDKENGCRSSDLHAQSVRENGFANGSDSAKESVSRSMSEDDIRHPHHGDEYYNYQKDTHRDDGTGRGAEGVPQEGAGGAVGWREYGMILPGERGSRLLEEMVHLEQGDDTRRGEPEASDGRRKIDSAPVDTDCNLPVDLAHERGRDDHDQIEKEGWGEAMLAEQSNLTNEYGYLNGLEHDAGYEGMQRYPGSVNEGEVSRMNDLKEQQLLQNDQWSERRDGDPGDYLYSSESRQIERGLREAQKERDSGFGDGSSSRGQGQLNSEENNSNFEIDPPSALKSSLHLPPQPPSPPPRHPSPPPRHSSPPPRHPSPPFLPSSPLSSFSSSWPNRRRWEEVTPSPPPPFEVLKDIPLFPERASSSNVLQSQHYSNIRVVPSFWTSLRKRIPAPTYFPTNSSASRVTTTDAPERGEFSITIHTSVSAMKNGLEQLLKRRKLFDGYEVSPSGTSERDKENNDGVACSCLFSKGWWDNLECHGYAPVKRVAGDTLVDHCGRDRERGENLSGKGREDCEGKDNEKFILSAMNYCHHHQSADQHDTGSRKRRRAQTTSSRSVLVFDMRRAAAYVLYRSLLDHHVLECADLEALSTKEYLISCKRAGEKESSKSEKRSGNDRGRDKGEEEDEPSVIDEDMIMVQMEEGRTLCEYTELETPISFHVNVSLESVQGHRGQRYMEPNHHPNGSSVVGSLALTESGSGNLDVEQIRRMLESCFRVNGMEIEMGDVAFSSSGTSCDGETTDQDAFVRDGARSMNVLIHVHKLANMIYGDCEVAEVIEMGREIAVQVIQEAMRLQITTNLLSSTATATSASLPLDDNRNTRVIYHTPRPIIVQNYICDLAFRTVEEEYGRKSKRRDEEKSNPFNDSSRQAKILLQDAGKEWFSEHHLPASTTMPATSSSSSSSGGAEPTFSSTSSEGIKWPTCPRGKLWLYPILSIPDDGEGS